MTANPICTPSSEEHARPDCIAKSLSLQYQEIKRQGDGTFILPDGVSAQVICYGEGIWRYDFADGSSLYCTYGVTNGNERFSTIAWAALGEEK